MGSRGDLHSQPNVPIIRNARTEVGGGVLPHIDAAGSVGPRQEAQEGDARCAHRDVRVYSNDL
jgi:hypothetical protein